MNDVAIIVPDVPYRVRQKISSQARRQNISRQEEVARILAAAYGIDREPREGTRFVPQNGSATMKVEVPAEVRQALRERAAVNGATIRGLVIAALAEHYGLPVPDPGRRPKS